MNALQFTKRAASISLSLFVFTAHAVNHMVEAAENGRMLNLRTVYPSVGDTVTLPAADEGSSYVVGNTNVAEMVEINVMRILRPGATSVAYYTGSSVATWNDCAEVTVPPAPEGLAMSMSGRGRPMTDPEIGRTQPTGRWCVERATHLAIQTAWMM